MAIAPFRTARSPLTNLSTEQLCLAELSFSYGDAEAADILEAIRAELHSRRPTFDDWRWDAIPKDGFELYFAGQGWRITPPYNVPSYKTQEGD